MACVFLSVCRSACPSVGRSDCLSAWLTLRTKREFAQEWGLTERGMVLGGVIRLQSPIKKKHIKLLESLMEKIDSRTSVGKGTLTGTPVGSRFGFFSGL